LGIPDLQLIAFSPLLVLLGGAGLVWLTGLGERTAGWGGWLAGLAVAVAALALVQSEQRLAVEWLRLPGGNLSLVLAGDGLSRLFSLATLALAGLLLLAHANTPLTEQQPSSGGERGVIFGLLLLAGLLLYYAAASWLTLVFGWAVSGAAAWLVFVADGAAGEGRGRVLGASFGGLTLLGIAVYLVRLNLTGEFSGLAAAVFANPVVLSLLLLALVGGLSLFPLYWLSSGESEQEAGWRGRGLVLAITCGLPEVYLLLRVERLAGGSLPDWWYGWLAALGGLNAILAAVFALRGRSAAAIFDGLVVAGNGLAVFAFALHSDAATLAALALIFAFALGRATLAAGMSQRLLAPVGALSLAALPPFAAAPAFWLLCIECLRVNSLLLWLPLGWLLLTLFASVALVVEARSGGGGLAIWLAGGLLSLASLAAGGLGDLALTYLAQAAGLRLPTLALPQWSAAGYGLGLLFLVTIGLAARRRGVVAAGERLTAPDVIAPVGEYLRFADWLHPRAWGGAATNLLRYVAGLLGNANNAVEGRYYLLATALLLLVALLVISR